MTLTKLCVLAISISVLNACGLIKDRSNEYAGVAKGNAIEIPPHLNDFKINPRFPIPAVDIEGRTSDKSFVLPKAPSTTSTQDEVYSVEEAGGEVWLNVAMSPGRVWPLLDFFVVENGLKIESENVSKGILNTRAVENSSTLTNAIGIDKLVGTSIQIGLSQGVRRKTSELNVVFPSEKFRNKPELKKAFLKAVGEFITSDKQQNRQSLLAHDIAGEPKVFWIDHEEKPYLKFKLGFERTWIELNKALQSSGVVLSDINREDQLFYVSYLSETEVDSWFITENAKAEKLKQLNFSVQVTKLEESDEEFYKISVKDLRVESEDEKATELLELIFENVS